MGILKKMLYFVIAVIIIFIIFNFIGSKENISDSMSKPNIANTPYSASNSYKKYTSNPIADFSAKAQNIKVFSDPSVLFDEGKYHMWFSCNNGKVSQICYASSNDGINWHPYPEPVFKVGRSGSWDDYNSEVPTVIKDNNIYKMWYAGYSYSKPDVYNIGLATSKDGINWKRLPVEESPYGKEGLVLVHDEAREGELLGIADPSVVKLNNTYNMWYNGFGTNNIVISHAISSDGIKWKRDIRNPVIKPSKPWEFVNNEGTVNQPSVLWNGRNFEIWYGSFADEYQRYTAISHAISNDGSNWIKDNEPSIVPGPEDLWPSTSSLIIGNKTYIYYIGFEKLGGPINLYLAISVTEK